MLESWPGLIKLDGRKADFVTPEGELLELKSDQYDMSKTANFFIELLSDLEKGKSGGPAQALTHGSVLWCYLYVKNRTMFTFQTKPLADWVHEHSYKYSQICIPNRSWITVGIKVPRTDLQHLYTERILK